LLTTLAWQIGAFGACFIYGSFFEWLLHRHVFHTRKFSALIFRAHTLIHHQRYRGDHTYQTHDDHPRHVPMSWWALPALLALHVPVFWAVQAVAGLPLLWGATLAVIVYFGVYESIHWAMHVPRAAGLVRRLPIYRWLDAHHRTHHQFMLSNLNVVFPLADLLLGTLRGADGKRLAPLRRRVLAPVSTPQSRR
jgi:hypothetical protein